MPNTETDPWPHIKDAMLAGIPASKIADEFGVTVPAIHARSHREQWPTQAKALRTRSSENVSPVLKLAAKSMTERGETLRSNVLTLVEEAFKTAKPKTLEKWSDIEIASRLADRVTGLERAQTNTILALPLFKSPEESPWLEIPRSSGTNEIQSGQPIPENEGEPTS